MNFVLDAIVLENAMVYELTRPTSSSCNDVPVNYYESILSQGGLSGQGGPASKYYRYTQYYLLLKYEEVLDNEFGKSRMFFYNSSLTKLHI